MRLQVHRTQAPGRTVMYTDASDVIEKEKTTSGRDRSDRCSGVSFCDCGSRKNSDKNSENNREKGE